MFKKKKSSSSSGKAFNPQEFLIFHGEKIVFALVALAAITLIYFGFIAKPYPSDKTPAILAQKADQVLKQVKEDHWPILVKAEAQRQVEPVFARDAIKSREPLDFTPYRVNIIDSKGGNSGIRRGDPAILAPVKLEPKYFSGALSVPSAKAAKVSETLSKLATAKEPEEKPKPEPTRGNNTRGGGGGAPPGYPGGGGGGAPPGYPGGGGGPPSGYRGGSGGSIGASSNDGLKRLSPGYDRGYQFGMQTHPDPMASSVVPDPKKEGPLSRSFVVVTALAPHAEMEDSFKKEFVNADGYMPGRDTPNYVGFEVQRVDVTDNPNKELADADWQPLPEASSEAFLKMAKASFTGTCAEVHSTEWTVPSISMPIPPILLQDYRKYASHSEISSLSTDSVAVVGIPSGGGESQDDEGKSGGAGASGGAPPGYPGAGGPPSGYSGGGGGAPPGYPGSGGGAPSGYRGGGGGAPPGYPGGGGGAPPGYPGSGGGAPPGYPGSGGAGGLAGPVVPPASAPKQLPSTKYKLVRFYDAKALPNKVYRYRARLLMNDSNYPELAAIQPDSRTLKPETMKRVQDQRAEDTKESKTGKRSSSRTTEWSEASPPIATIKPASVHVGETTASYATPYKDPTAIYEASPPKAEMVYAEWDKENGIFVPHKDTVERGWVFGAAARDSRGKEQLPEIIHPITKMIKVLSQNTASNLVTVIDLDGMVPLSAWTGKDNFKQMKSGGEAVSYDPSSKQLVISREFDDFNSFGLHAEPSKPTVGPLGGGLKVVVNSSPAGGGAPGMGGAGPAAGGGSKPSFGGASGGTGNSGSSSASASD